MARILVVDDEEGIRSFLAEALEGAGHQVTQAADGLAGLDALSRHAFDLVLTDLKMPGLDGMSLLKHVRAEQPDVEVIVLTAYATVQTAVDAMRLGAHNYLQKPIGSPAELRMVVARALERRALLALKTRTQRQEESAPLLTYGAPAMRPVTEALAKVARTHATVLLLGESGTGKELAARALHRLSGRPGPFVAVNCAALSPSILESELFGHEKGAFTGANTQRRGRVELADGGTFFLDEIGELKSELQVKLLRLLQERTFERVGGNRTIEVDVRWVAATNADLVEMIRDGAFREDLYHRLAVFPLRLPPLRERREDIAPLARHLLAQIAAEMGRPPLTLSDAALRLLERGHWPGNVRQLRNVLERGAILTEGGVLDLDALPAPEAPDLDTSAPLRLDEVERQTIAAALAETEGNRRRAAERLGIPLRTFYVKLKRYALS